MNNQRDTRREVRRLVRQGVYEGIKRYTAERPPAVRVQPRQEVKQKSLLVNFALSATAVFLGTLAAMAAGYALLIL